MIIRKGVQFKAILGGDMRLARACGTTGQSRNGASYLLYLVFGFVVFTACFQGDCLLNAARSSDRNIDPDVGMSLERGPMKRLARSICLDQDVKIDNAKQMLALIEAVSVDEDLCRERYLQSIIELSPILRYPRNKLCDDHAFNLMRDYHFRFISNPKEVKYLEGTMRRNVIKRQLYAQPRKWTVSFDQNDRVLATPVTIRYFFLRFALEVSLTCKRNLLANLKPDSERLLTQDDKDIMLMFDRQTPIGSAIGSGLDKIDFDSALYIPDLDGELKGAAGVRAAARRARGDHSNHIKVLKTKASEDSALYKMVLACRNRFKPIYDKLIVPVSRLSKLGYDYQGPLLSETERNSLTDVYMKQWLSLMHVCEIVKEAKLIKVTQVDLVEEGDKKNSDDKSQEGDFVEVKDEKESSQLLARAMEETEIESLKSGSEYALWYEPTVKVKLEENLADLNEKGLDLELSRKQGHISPFGLRRKLRKLGGYLKWLLARFDFDRFTHFRRNSSWYSGMVNFLTITAIGTGTVICILGMVGVVG